MEIVNSIDLSYLRVTFGDNNEIINKVLKSFIEGTPPLLMELQENAAKNNWDVVREIAHKIKSSYNTIGAKQVGNFLAKLEEDAIGGDQTILSMLVLEIDEESKLVFKEVEIELNK